MDAILAQLSKDSSDKEEKIDRLNQKQGMFIGLAKRIAFNVEDVDAAVRELTRAVEVAEKMEESADPPTNTDDQVQAVPERMAKQNAFGDFDGAAQRVDCARAFGGGEIPPVGCRRGSRNPPPQCPFRC